MTLLESDGQEVVAYLSSPDSSTTLSRGERYEYSIQFRGDPNQEYLVGITEYVQPDASDTLGIHIVQENHFFATGEDQLVTGFFDLGSTTHAVELRINSVLPSPNPFFFSDPEFSDKRHPSG